MLRRPKNEQVFDLRERPAFKSLVEYVESQPTLSKYLMIGGDGVPRNIRQWPISTFVQSLVDRYLNIYRDTEYSQERLLELYKPLEKAAIEDSLSVDVAVPILFLAFEEQNETVLDDKVAVFRMDEDFHMARASKRAYGPGVHDSVMSAATHALILKGYEIPNRGSLLSGEVTSNVNWYPLQKIDTFFAALRIVTGFDTGYAQLLLIPKGWARVYVAHLPPLEGTSIRGYPDWFENFHWLKPRRVVSNIELKSAGGLFSRLVKVFGAPSGKRLSLASQRLNRCFLRGNEEDAILDVTIALEILLSAGDSQEITHKLATRLAALSTLDKRLDHTPAQVYRNVKRVYALRSAVAHGDAGKKIAKARQIRVGGKEVVSTLEIAIKYLRAAIAIMAENPDYMDPSAIDERLLLGSLGRGAEARVD